MCNPKLILSILTAWALAFSTIYFFRDELALLSFAQNGIPDEAFRWAPVVGGGIIRVLLYFSLLLFTLSGLIYACVQFREKVREERVERL